MPELALSPLCRQLLEADGVPVPEDTEARLATHCALIRAWHDYLSLVSTGDLARLESEHVPDALSLAGLVRQYGSGGLLDIGPGGGFPAIPIAVLLPEVPMILVERSAKKVGFLRKVCGSLGLKNVHLVHGEFPHAVAGMAASVITARAVENPAKLTRGLAERVACGAVYLCQTGVSWDGALAGVRGVPVEDRWISAGLRRGDLRVVRLG